MQKLWFKIEVGKLMKIFFIRNVLNNIPWSLKVFPVMPVTIFPRKTMKIHAFSYQSAAVGLSIVNQSYHAHDRTLHYGAGRAAVLSRLVLEGFCELEGAVQTEQCCLYILQPCRTV